MSNNVKGGFGNFSTEEKNNLYSEIPFEQNDMDIFSELSISVS